MSVHLSDSKKPADLSEKLRFWIPLLSTAANNSMRDGYFWDAHVAAEIVVQDECEKLGFPITAYWE